MNNCASQGEAVPFMKIYSLSFLEAIFFALIEQVGFGSPEINNFGTSFITLFQLITFPTIVGIGYPGITTNNTATCIRAVIALVTNVHQNSGIDKRGTRHTDSIACSSQYTNKIALISS